MARASTLVPISKPHPTFALSEFHLHDFETCDPDKPMSEEQQIIIYNTADGRASVALFARDGMVWMNQNQLAQLFDTSKQNIGQHIGNILDDKELRADPVVKDYFTTATDGKDYKVTFYSLEMILAVGFRVRSVRGTQFRQWANRHLSEYMVKGFVMDDDRLKQPDGRPDYFDELLARIRDVRASEKRFYQKVRDLSALSSDYDPSDKATQMFFAETQNNCCMPLPNRPPRNWWWHVPMPVNSTWALPVEREAWCANRTSSLPRTT